MGSSSELQDDAIMDVGIQNVPRKTNDPLHARLPHNEDPGSVDVDRFTVQSRRGIQKGGLQDLDEKNQETFRKQVDKVQYRLQEPHGDHEEHGHGHAPKPHSIITACMAALINYLLMFGLSCAFGMIMFADDFNKQHRAIAVKASLCTAFFMGLVKATFSTCPVAIGGTDLNPVVFIGGMAVTLAEEIANHVDLRAEYMAATGQEDDTCATGGRLLDEYVGRLLGGSSSGSGVFCNDAIFLASHQQACDSYHERLRATVIFTTAISSAILGSIYFVLGKFGLARYVAYMPTSISDAFLSCVGYKVFKYALKFCKYKIVQFLPAAFIGVLLYFLKALHVGNPAVVMPLGLLLPLGLFWAGVYAFGSDVTKARNDGLLFPEMDDLWFYTVWTDSIPVAASIDFKAWTKTIPDLVIMIIVCILDASLKINAMEGKMPLKGLLKNYELKIAGYGNILMTVCGAPVGYQQLKFSVINYGVMGNITDRKGGIIYALLCGITWLTTIAHFNVIPRFFLSMLLFFAGAGFVAENLWGSRKYLSFAEWIEVLAILAVFIISGQLLYAVVTGCVLCGISFIRKYAKVPAIEGRPLTGLEVVTTHKSPDRLSQACVEHMLGKWLMMVRLKGYVFFASSQSITKYVYGKFDEEDEAKLPDFKRLKYIIMDCKMLDGMDASGAIAFVKLSKFANERGVRVLWCEMSSRFAEELKGRDIVKADHDWHVNVEGAMMYVYDEAMKFRAEHQKKWLMLNDAVKENVEAWQLRVKYDPFVHVFTTSGMRAGVPWQFCKVVEIKKCVTVLHSHGQVGGSLFLVHSGSVGLYSDYPIVEDEIQDDADEREFPSPIVIYTHGWFVNTEACTKMPANGFAVALEDGYVLQFDQRSWFRMAFERPLMMSDLMRSVMCQQVMERESASKLIRSGMPGPKDYLYNFDEDMDDGIFDGKIDGEAMPRQTSSPSQDTQKISSSVNTMSSSKALGNATRLANSNEGRALSLAWARQQRGMDLLDSMPLIKARLTELRAASALGSLGFFDDGNSNPGHQLPELPELKKQDLVAAFFTYAAPNNINEDQPEPLLEPRKVEQALMYAGFFDWKPEDIGPDKLNLEQFMGMGRSQAFRQLNQQQVATLRGVFKKYDTDHSGTLDKDEVSAAMRFLLKLDMDLPSIQSITYTFVADQKDKSVSFDCFVAAVSWFVKQCESEWDLIVAVKGMFDGALIASADGASCIKKEHLVKQSLARGNKEAITEEQAEEMLWMADWRVEGTGEGDSMDLTSFFCAILACFDQEYGELPEYPIRTLEQWRKDRESESMMSSMAPACFVAPSARRSAILSAQKPDHKEWTKYADDNCVWRAWLIFEQPENPRARPLGPLWNVISLTFIVLSALCMVVEPIVSPSSKTRSDAEHWTWYGIEIFFTALFGAELLIKLIVHLMITPRFNTVLEFFSLPTNMCDFVAILPLFIELILDEAMKSFRLLRLVRLARLSRLVRLVKLSKKQGFQVAAPASIVLVVIWGIFLIHEQSTDETKK